MDYGNYEENRDAYFERRKTEIATTVKYERRRLYKTEQRAEKIYRKFSGQKTGHGEQLRRRLETLSVKSCNIKSKIYGLRSLYIETTLMQCGIPLNFINDSRTYTKNDEHHILLGYFAKDIGVKLHGHIIITPDGKLRYARLPGEAHGCLYHIHPPVTPSEFFNGEYANYKRIIALQTAEIRTAKNENETKLACSGA